MSIRILAESEIKQAATGFFAPPLLFANPKNLYQRRAARLRKLSENHPLQDYLRFCANIADAQLDLLQTAPIAIDVRLSAVKDNAALLAQQPLHWKNWQRDPIWLELLQQLLQRIKPSANDAILATIEWLEKASASELNALASQLLRDNMLSNQSDKAIFLWAALSLYWTQLVQQIPHQAKTELGENRQFCPVCGSAPVASTIQLGEVQGTRYLHCSLCESEWHMVRVKCSNCEQGGKLNYWSLDSDHAVKSESCDDCHSYLKVLYQDKNPEVEAVADDLASLFLDDEMEKMGYAKSAVNPFLFPSE
ncbi:formate dehydrogenase accessory protein FdhE [Testudinibacter sp. TR-2022]|uniref:formate dehydrogenase accessory protein FdhE n=2 Tax=Testudinibacter sp. TR-2022 TaxID=2585029 RepID=UPI00111981F8|nr:formate dehydrogenase accessory protein FdhE [Testudinibacter sp. TR-2022]TNH05553.1 formate dehydrogenase accessory protein FdhE [Pasteurellaceae bacterium Phil31]TNH11045.1 formate dehydrogenase accessory protein FdhE [Testudinibacter sp. TR-2022]TNH12981.1 formate dehydrogenase accessory protein FdhE [Testudinibacter sp. TR-2022]TNH16390.1 formate dehydrogenase accessory protein FdhE [Testudinibacter sp. TR-2022]